MTIRDRTVPAAEPQHGDSSRFDEVLRLVREAEPIGPPSFLADTLHLLAFTSDRWDGRWWETLRWKLLESCRLDEPA